MTTTDFPKPWRRTPLIYSTKLSKEAGCQIYLKLENLQPSGSFKSRGVGNFMLAHLAAESKSPGTQKLHFFISSGGNAGLGCVHAANTLGASATIVVPMTTSAYMISKIKDAGATDIIQQGTSWVEADTYLKQVLIPEAERKGEKPVYVPPFDAPEIWQGNSTIIDEILLDLGQAPDVVICSVGGGGLFSGIMMGQDRAAETCQAMQVIAVETKGADSLALSLAEEKLSTLPGITSMATSLGARTVAQQAFEYATRASVKSVVLSDQDAMEGCVRFANDERMMVEPACGVCLALCYKRRLREVVPNLAETAKVVVVVCGGSNVSEKMLHDWAEHL